jgi:hypothetical protein
MMDEIYWLPSLTSLLLTFFPYLFNMKLIGKHIEKDRSGHVTICPEESDDMWHIYNILMPGDRLKAVAFRWAEAYYNGR